MPDFTPTRWIMKAFAGKVLIIVQNLPAPFDRRVWLEAQTLRDHGYKVSIICPKSAEHPEKFIRIDNISIYRYTIPVNARGAAGYFLEFAWAWLATALLSLKVLRREGFDIIQACNPPDTYFLLALIYRMFGKRFIFDHHDLAPEMYLAKYNRKGGLLYKGLLLLERLTLRTAEVVMTTNESYKKVAVQRGRKNPDDVFVLRTGPDLTRLRPVTPNNQYKHGKPLLVCYLGEMCPQDGVDYLLQSAAFINKEMQRRDIQFVLMGGGPAQPFFRAMSEKMGLDEFVHFTGRIADVELCKYLSTADVCVDPDPHTEWSNLSTMNKVLEYMVFAKPIVSYDLLETRYSAQDAAIYVPANDPQEFARHIVELLDDPQRRERMGNAGLQRVSGNLCWQHTHNALLNAYKRVALKKRLQVKNKSRLLSRFVRNRKHKEKIVRSDNDFKYSVKLINGLL